MNPQRVKSNKTRQEFLLSFFNDNGYEEKQVNSFWLVKQWNGNTKDWQVAIYSNQSFNKYKEFTDKGKQLDWIKHE